MTRNEALALGIGITGLGGYLYFAYQKCWFPFSMTERCKEAPPSPPGAPNPPGMPLVSNITVIDQNRAEADVSWNAVPNATYYRVYVDGNVVADNVRTTSCHITNLIPGRTHQIQVAACI
jgi:hypothetical protein